MVTADKWLCLSLQFLLVQLLGSCTDSLQSLATLEGDYYNALDDDLDAPIHYLVKRKGGQDLNVKKLLFNLLTYTKADVDLKDGSGRTALHTAAEVGAYPSSLLV